MADVSVKMGISGLTQFKQGMADAAAQVKTLDAAMKANEKQIKTAADAERVMASQATLLNAKLEAQRSIVKNAQQALTQMEQNGVRKTSKAYQDMQRQMIEAQTAIWDTQEKLEGLGQAEEETAEKADKLGTSLGGISKKMSLDQVIGGIGSITNALEKAAKTAVNLGETIWSNIMDSAKWADDTETMALMYGVDLDTFLRVQKLVESGLDTSVEAILKSQSKLKKNIGTGSDAFMETMKELGLLDQMVNIYGEHFETLSTYDPTEMFWKAGRAIMELGDEYEQEAKAQELFGKSWRELIPLFTKYQSQEEFQEALDDVKVLSEDDVDALAELNDKVAELKANFKTLSDEVWAQMAPALTNAAEALNGLLTSVLDYLDTEAGQEALDHMASAVAGLFEDLGEIDPEKVVEGFTGVFDKIVGGLQWLDENRETLVGAMKGILMGWGALKLTGGALQLLKLINGITGLTIGGEAAGAAAGAAWGAGFANAVTAAAPWLIGLYTLLNPAETGNNDLADTSGAMTAEGWSDFFWQRERASEGHTQDNRWYDLIIEAGEIVEAAADLWNDAEGIRALAKYAQSGDKDQLAKDLQALGYVLRMAEEPAPATETGGGTVLGIDTSKPLRKKSGEIIPIGDLLTGAEEAPVMIGPVVPEDAAEDIAEDIGPVNLPVHFTVEDFDWPEEEHFTMEDFDWPEHANGIWSVPFDGYMAMLHKGERVVPAREVNSRSFSSNLYVESMYMNNGTDAAGLASAMAAAQKRTMAGFGS